MQILTLFLLTLSVASGQQQQRPRFRNPGFQNVRTPLATSSARDRPFISIPIVLLPDGRPLPKPRQQHSTTYHYVGHATQNRQGQQKGGKPRAAAGKQAAASYQVAIPSSVTQRPKKVNKPPKLTAAQLNGHVRPTTQGGPAKYRAPQQAQRQQQQPTFDQTQQVHQVQYVKQRAPFQQQAVHPSAVHKQNVANFVSFATNLGAAVAAQQQQNQPVILPTQTPASGMTFSNQANHKMVDTYLSQRPLLANHKLNGGMTYQHQVPNPQAAHAHYTQVPPNHGAENHHSGYAVHQQQQQQDASQQQQQPQEQEQVQQHSPPSENQYLAATSVRPDAQTPNQGSAEFQSNVPYQSNQAGPFQQSGNTGPRSQGNVALVASSFGSQPQQGHQQQQQGYAVAAAQQQSTPPPPPQVAGTYVSQAPAPKAVLSVQQQQPSPVAPSQSSYVNQNQAPSQNSPPQPISYSSNNPSPAYASQGGGAQANSEPPLSYFQYQTAQELPLGFPAIFATGQPQSGYAQQQSDQEGQQEQQPYAILPSAQNLYASSVGPAIYVSPQQEENAPAPEVQTYEAYGGDPSAYHQPATQGAEKSYPGPQYGFLLQNSQSAAPANDGQGAASVGQLLFDSSSPRQVNYSPAYQNNNPYASHFKSEAAAQPSVLHYRQPAGVVTPGSTYAKPEQNEAAKQQQQQEAAASEQQEESEDSDYDEDEETNDDEASYKVVYIPLDILKNILSNSVENGK